MSKGIPIFDGHNDTLLSLYKPERGKGRSFFERSNIGHIDLPRAKESNFAGGFFAIFVPNPKSTEQTVPTDKPPLPAMLDYGYAMREAMAMAALLFDLEREADGQFKVVRTVDDLEHCLANDIMAAIFHFEGAEPIDEDLHSLDVFYQAGLRSLGIVWSRPNKFGHGVPFGFNQSPDTGDGLTKAGKRLVRRCNELGIMLDLSHLNEKGFHDVAKISDAPLVATHSNVHAISPTTRNLTDEQLAIIKASDGMVGLNFAVYFLSEDGKRDEELPLETMKKHLDYLIEHLGEERVGLGSDFDGAHITQKIKDVAGLPNLVRVLREGGYDDALLKKLLHENWVRVLRKTWKA